MLLMTKVIEEEEKKIEGKCIHQTATRHTRENKCDET